MLFRKGYYFEMVMSYKFIEVKVNRNKTNNSFNSL